MVALFLVMPKRPFSPSQIWSMALDSNNSKKTVVKMEIMQHQKVGMNILKIRFYCFYVCNPIQCVSNATHVQLMLLFICSLNETISCERCSLLRIREQRRDTTNFPSFWSNSMTNNWIVIRLIRDKWWSMDRLIIINSILTGNWLFSLLKYSLEMVIEKLTQFLNNLDVLTAYLVWSLLIMSLLIAQGNDPYCKIILISLTTRHLIIQQP